MLSVVFRLKNTKIIEKIARCARAKHGQSDLQSRGSAADNGEGEDPAKMTYSRTDLLDRDRPKRWPQELRDDPVPGWRLRDGTLPGCSALLMAGRDCNGGEELGYLPLVVHQNTRTAYISPELTEFPGHTHRAVLSVTQVEFPGLTALLSFRDTQLQLSFRDTQLIMGGRS